MNSLKEEGKRRVKDVDKDLIKVAIMDIPGVVMVGLGLYGKFAAKGDAFHPFLNNKNNVHIVLVIGAAIMMFSAYKYITLIVERSKLCRNRH